MGDKEGFTLKNLADRARLEIRSQRLRLVRGAPAEMPIRPAFLSGSSLACEPECIVLDALVQEDLTSQPPRSLLR